MLFCRAYRPLFSSSSFYGHSRHLGTHSGRSLRPPTRGQNLSDRYGRLERALQEQHDRIKETGRHYAAAVTPVATAAATTTSTPKKQPETFHGFLIPKEPQPPLDDECCMSNCAICVYDLYEESLDEYRKSVADVRSSLTALKLPEDEWPSSLRSKDIQGIGSRKETVLSAFEEMERALAKKHESEDAPSPVRLSQPAAAASQGVIRQPRPQTRAVSWLESAAALYEGFRWLLFSNR